MKANWLTANSTQLLLTLLASQAEYNVMGCIWRFI